MGGGGEDERRLLLTIVATYSLLQCFHMLFHVPLVTRAEGPLWHHLTQVAEGQSEGRGENLLLEVATDCGSKGGPGTGKSGAHSPKH